LEISSRSKALNRKERKEVPQRSQRRAKEYEFREARDPKCWHRLRKPVLAFFADFPLRPLRSKAANRKDELRKIFVADYLEVKG
jgi:hypothetical protein